MARVFSAPPVLAPQPRLGPDAAPRGECWVSSRLPRLFGLRRLTGGVPAAYPTWPPSGARVAPFAECGQNTHAASGPGSSHPIFRRASSCHPLSWAAVLNPYWIRSLSNQKAHVA